MREFVAKYAKPAVFTLSKSKRFKTMSTTFWKPTVNALESTAHKIYVKRLYRRSLRLAQDWYWRREEFREKALIIRGYFDAGRNITNLREAEEALGHTEHLLAVYRHPQPFTCNAAFSLLFSQPLLDINSNGGTKFERNTPFPPEVYIDAFIHTDLSLSCYTKELHPLIHTHEDWLYSEELLMMVAMNSY